jgi:polyhydroxyalkanoate synthesis regulator phasin
MSNMNAEERDKILDDFIKDSKKDLNETIAREKARLDDYINQYKTKFAQKLLEQFNEEIKQLRDSLKNGNYFDASTHFITANWLNKELKERGF